MEVKVIDTKDFYNTMVKWWKGQNFPAVSPAMLPEKTFVCYNDSDMAIYSCCFYNTDSHLAWVGWQIANPEATSEEKKGGLKYLLEEMDKYARYRGYLIMFTTSNTESVESKLGEIGFSKGDENVNHYIKIL